MSGSITLAPNVAPSASIGFATGGAPGKITVPKPAPTPSAAPKPSTPPPTPAPSPTYVAPAYTPQVYAPALDTGKIFTQASNNANANVNPYYTKLLNDFIGNQAQAKTLQQQQTQTNIQNIQAEQARVQQANAVAGERTTQDAATQEAQAAATADNRQLDQGTAFNAARNAEAGKIAQSGLTGSGLGANQEAQSQATQDQTEQRQAVADQEVKSATELTKARTFEDLGTSNTNAASAAKTGEAQANFDLNKFIIGQTQDLSGEQQQLESQRQASLAQEQQNQTKLLVNNFINSIANPAQRQAAYATYGSFL